MPKRLLLTCLALLLSCAAMGQQLGRISLHGMDYFSLHDLARGLGTSATRLGSSLVIRTGFGILTVFEGEQEFLWLAGDSDTTLELRLDAPVMAVGGQLLAPLSLIGQLGGTVSGIVVVLPDRTRLLLADGLNADPGGTQTGPASLPDPTAGNVLPGVQSGSHMVQLGNGVQALRLSGQVQSVLLVDAGLLALAYPERRQEFDDFLAGLSGFRPIYFVLSSGDATEAELSFGIVQGGVAERLQPDDGLVVLQGDPELVAPGRPVSGVLLLPSGINLRLPLQVEWSDQTSSMVFRR